jgi:hypothetical protein
VRVLHTSLIDRALVVVVVVVVAADVQRDCTVIAMDLPGHDTSPARAHCDRKPLDSDLAHSLGMTQSPVAVEHGNSAALAQCSPRARATHAFVTVVTARAVEA